MFWLSEFGKINKKNGPFEAVWYLNQCSKLNQLFR
ncbi:hypothetical protein BN8_06659 [Fibrisoma limi BUZ 3]|uniref:Uncharacterized protein n=1 Tax=Fibrisoma limi BUZ 3 TaxID=1185876 RepID=I2GTM2_9BACT|nr:hypothetical protein BN8_06659 [Fibrisoma limi BUZ 3]